MPNDDKLTFLEQLSNALVGQTVTGGARALGEGIGYKYHGGAWSDIPDVMREALERHKVKSANQTKNEQDALAVASGLAAMSNPISAVGHGIDFAAAVPEMLEYKLSDAEPPIGMIAETGLKRRLQKGGAAADYAVANQLERAKANLRGRGMIPYEPEAFLPISSKNANWGLGEGKFQAIKDYQTTAYDLAKKSLDPMNVGMGQNDINAIITGHPHELGVEFSNTMGLAPQYRGKGYGKEIYQNMADVYGGGISHSGSTTPEARKVYERLGGIDTGIRSGGGTRQALPTREMKADPEALAAFEQKVKQYAKKKTKPNTLNDLLEGVDNYEAQSIYDVMVGDAQANRPVSAEQLADMMFSSTGEQRSWRTMPRELDLEGEIWVRTPDSRTYSRQQAQPTKTSDIFENFSPREINDFSYQMRRSQDAQGHIHESDISYLLDNLFNMNVQGRNIPDKLELGSDVYVRIPNTARYKRQR